MSSACKSVSLLKFENDLIHISTFSQNCASEENINFIHYIR